MDRRTLLRNRPLDVWMHEQDVRRAVGRPGGLDTAAARHTAEYLAESLGYVLGKKVGAPAGTSLVLEMEGSAPFAFEVDGNGRGQRVAAPADPTATLHMDRESFIRLAGGRCAAEPGKVTVDGDRELGEQVLDQPRHHTVTAKADAWQLADIPDQGGRTVVVTGTSLGGLGHHTALELARRGARVVLAGRNPAKLDETAGTIRAEVPAAELEQLEVDLADLESVRRAGEAATEFGPIDVLVNNAGVMGTSRERHRRRARPAAGDQPLRAVPAHRAAAAAAGRQQGRDRRHRLVEHAPGRAQRAARRPARAPRPLPRSGGSTARPSSPTCSSPTSSTAAPASRSCRVRALAAHPGFAGTHLAANGQYGRSSGGIASILDATVKAVSQPAAHGAWPVLMAATADLPGATYVGPGGLGEMTGRPRVVTSSGLSRDEDAQRRLWELSEETTGISYP